MVTRSNPLSVWRYDRVAVSFHWVMAVLIIGMIALGWYMTSIDNSPNSGFYFNTHKSFGVLVGILIVLRLAWRLTHKPVPLPASILYWQASLARLIHWLLYLCMFLMPFTGFMGASYGKHGVKFFGLQIPRIVTQNETWSDQLFTAHGIIVWILVGLIVLHTLAAFKHLFINKDRVFQRMYY
jgi:cytochrome b561